MKNLLAVLFMLFPAVSWASGPTLGNPAYNSVTLTVPLAVTSGGTGTNTIGTMAFQNSSSVSISAGSASNFVINSSGNIQTNNFQDGVGRTFTYTSASVPLFFVDAGTTGTPGATSMATITNFSDTATCGTAECSTLAVNTNLNTGFTGPRNTVQLYAAFQGQSGNTADVNRQYVTETEYMFVNSSDGGTAPTPGNSGGFFFVENPQMHVGPTATNLSGLFNMEMDNFSSVGATYQSATALLIQNIMLTTGNNGRDTAISLGGSTGNTGWNYGILFADDQINNSLRAGSTVLGGFNGSTIDFIGVAGVPTITPKPAYGIDFSTMHITSDAFLSEGVALSNSSAQIGAAFLTSTPTVTGLDVPDYSSTGATVTNGGTSAGTLPFLVGDTLWAYSCGGEFTVTSVSSGSVTGVSQVTPCTMSTQSSSAIAVTGGSGRGATLTMTWNTAAQKSLVLASSGEAIKLGSGAFTANGTTSLSLTNIAPSGAHATVQEWLTITDAGGTVRYIPAF